MAPDDAGRFLLAGSEGSQLSRVMHETGYPCITQKQGLHPSETTNELSTPSL